VERCHREQEDRHWSGLEAMRPALHGYLSRRCRDVHEADDIVQDTLVRAARYRRSLTSAARLRSWVLRIAANVFRDHVRRTSRLPRVGVDEETLERAHGPHGDAHDSRDHDDALVEVDERRFDRETLLRLLRQVYAELPEHDRLVLRSYYGGEESCAVTALECGISAGLVKVRLFRARRRLERGIRAGLAQPGCAAGEVR
jgi:RNA polymerase sigma-70 factor (ECF subfamily)